MIAYVPAALGAAAAQVVHGVLDLMRGGAGDVASRGWVAACTRSAVCIPACPEAVDPMLMLRLAKFAAHEHEHIPSKDVPEVMSRVKAFGRLTFTKDEQRDWQ